MTAACNHARVRLEAFVDGELNGVDRLAVSRHLEQCEPCQTEERELRSLGDLLRSNAPALIPRDIGGLAGGVISRVRAEQAQSWRALLARSMEDWHWALVGAGSVAAGFFSVVFVAAMLSFGPAPERADSLEAVLNNLGTPAGTLFLVASPGGRGQTPRLMQFDSGTDPEATEANEAFVSMPNGFAEQSERDLVLALSEALVTPDGRMSDLRLMSNTRRQQTVALLDRIQRIRSTSPAQWSGGALEIRQLSLVTNTVCNGKALLP